MARGTAKRGRVRGRRANRSWTTAVLLVSLAAALGLTAGASAGLAQPAKPAQPAGPAQPARLSQKGPGKTVVIEVLDGLVSPDIVVIGRGGTVVWQNVTDWWVRVNFNWEAQPATPCAAAKGGKAAEALHPSTVITPGGRVSLCFAVPGTYYYLALPDGNLDFGTPPARGIIVVQDD
ncbi:MAG: hypothetical protein ACE5IM_13095 [Nitrospinota bacterium]